MLPIETPAIPLYELNRLTDNFGQNALIGEGSYGRVFFAKLSNGQDSAIKKLDTGGNSTPDEDADFAAQVSLPNMWIIAVLVSSGSIYKWKF